MPGVNLLDFPQGLATQLGISLFAGQILASVIFLTLCLFPTLFLARRFRLSHIAVWLVGVMALSFCVALAWLPIWTFTIIILGIALFFSKKIIGLF